MNFVHRRVSKGNNCGVAPASPTVIMRRSQPKILRAITNSPRYVTNHTLHTDINIPYVSDVIHDRINKHHNKLEAHPSALLEPLPQPINTKRLKTMLAFRLSRHVR